jgi:manganese-dependent ADP-ribose/CDP-alcohol diphosphatase
MPARPLPSFTRRRFLAGTAAAATAPSLARAASSGTISPLFQIGLAADAQYADVPAKGSRFYRESTTKLAAAVAHFNGQPLEFCVHLGDLIDRGWDHFDSICQPLATCHHPWHHLLGNHDFEVADGFQPLVPGRLGIPSRYRFFDYLGFRFALLDTNDISTYAHVADSPPTRDAQAELERLAATGAPSAKPWNGAIGPGQLAWLEETCTTAAQAGLKVIALSHHPLLPVESHAIWNAKEVLALTERHRNLVAWINGHNHAGGLAHHDGLPCLTLHGMVETEHSNAFATAAIHPDRLVLTGHGRQTSLELTFRS